MILLSAVVLAGIPMLDTESQAGADASAFEDIDRVQKANYVTEHYDTSQEDSNRTLATVYVRQEDGDVLSKTSLLETLRYQRDVLNNDSVAAVLHDDGIADVANMVAVGLADDPAASLDEQIATLEDASPAAVETQIESTLSNQPQALRLLPDGHDPSNTTATDRRLLVVLNASGAAGGSEGVFDRVDAALYETAQDYSDSGLFVLNQFAYAEYNSHFFGEMVWLVLPAALVLILGVLAFTYRDLIDIVVGMVGVLLSVLWMFGLLGWLGVAAGLVSIVPVVLVTGLSIDFGFHVFNRYREQREASRQRAGDARGDGGIREPMNRGVRLVATALVLVTVTAAIGFLSNLVNPLGQIRDLGVSITLGVIASLLLFVTVVPALKISIDGLFERFGWDRHKRALGHGRFLRPALSRTVTLARRGAPIVLVVALVIGSLGAVAWTDLDEESFQQPDGEVAEWKQSLPDPIGWDTHPVAERLNHVQAVYQPATADDAFRERILIEGDVTADGTLTDLQAGVETISERGVLLDQPGVRAVTSPVTAMQALAQRDPAFRAVFEDESRDTDGDGIPDRDLKPVYDAFYEADSELAGQVLERTDGEYRSMLVRVALDADFADIDQAVADLEAGADRMEGDSDRTATAVGSVAVNVAVLDAIVGGILQTMTIALAAIALVMAVAFRAMHGSATLGLIVAVPIALVLGLVIGGMYLLSIPLTLLTALLMSLVIGLGIDYNIHIGDRFADERREGKTTVEALEAAVTGTGGALLGSTLTSAGAFATIALVPDPQLQSFSLIVVVALLTAFLVSLLVLPSLLVLWERYSPEAVTTEATAESLPQD
ncbi:efflux RND transporter permease subunit [Halapricum hydrolyticum]|uniref:MMPL family transporter n=1 Tax=Halapricum hydrolyticum TaxID=2979991 RepID=A0AAE3IAP7_9EURY|nr:MMPL family transporter [Halapricum hydrolyticum]MCU4717473.1 MMPL family transporter [Halapricum hydrolyticum]MCU4726637.1 MMPL family transporter [Halapricum hydrolyticum]